MIEIKEIEPVTRAQAERWAPRYVYEQPDFTNIKEAQAYMEREEQRWYEGYNGLNGWHYKYLTQYKIPDARGKMIRPIWRDGDHEVTFSTIDECKTSMWDKFTLKRREYGLSSVDGGIVPLEIAQRNPGCTIKLTSADENRTKELMNKKVKQIALSVYAEAEELYKKVGGKGAMWRPNIRYTASDMTVHVEFEHGVTSTIEGVQTSKGPDSATKMEGPRILYALIDEFFLHKFGKQVWESADGSRNEGFVRAGWMSIGGTAGASTAETSLIAQDMWANHESYKINIVFIPATLCIAKAYEYDSDGRMSSREIPNGFMVNGYSLQNEAKEWIGKTRNILKSLQDKTKYWQYVKQYPLSPDEIFETSGASGWEIEERARFDQQRKRIFAVKIIDKIEPVHCFLQEVGGRIEAKEDISSPIVIIRPPVKGYNYICGIDPIPIVARKESDDRSSHAAAIKCIETNTYDAYYMERHKDSSRLAYRTVLLQRHYNTAPAMLERNRADALIKEYEIRDWTRFLAKEIPTMRPHGSKYIEIGYVKHTHNGDWLMDNLMDWGREFDEKTGAGGIESIWDLVMLEQLLTMHTGNKDLADAMQAAEVLHWWYRERDRRRNAQENTESNSVKKVPVKMLVNGRVQVVWVEVNSQNNNRLGAGFTNVFKSPRR